MPGPVLITGVGCISPFGIGRVPFADGLMSGVSAAAPVTAFETSGCRSRRAAVIQGFDPIAFIPPLKLRRIDNAGRLAIACTRLALEDARLSPGSQGSDEIGVALGTYTAGLDSIVEYLGGLNREGPTGVPALIFSNTVSNAPASLCAIEFGLRGPNVTFNQREASSLAALGYAVRLIREQRIDAMICGGIDRVEEIFFRMHDRFRALSPSRRRRSGGTEVVEEFEERSGGEAVEAARPFDRRRNGFVLGEGGFVLLLESAASAMRRGARVYAEVLGIGITASSTPLNRWPADGSGIARAMRLAIDDARMTAADVDAVLAAANGSPELDRLEACAIREVMSDRSVAVGSIKGAIGEFAACGAAAVITGLSTIPLGVLPPTAGFGCPDPECPVGVRGIAQSVAGPTFLVNGVASGGTNCSAVLRAVAA